MFDSNLFRRFKNRLASIFFYLRKHNRRKIDTPSEIDFFYSENFEIVHRKNTADIKVINHSFENDIFLRELTEYSPKSGDCVIDIGAHIGTFSLLTSKLVYPGMVYAIEPSEDTYNLLQINVKINACNNIMHIKKSLSDNNLKTVLYHSPDGNWGNTTVSNVSEVSEEVENITLEKLFNEYKIEFCNLIKMNCEGAEFPSILATPDFIFDKIGTLLILYHNDLWTSNSYIEIENKLRRNRFKIQYRNQTKKRGWIIANKSD